MQLLSPSRLFLGTGRVLSTSKDEKLKCLNTYISFQGNKPCVLQRCSEAQKASRIQSTYLAGYPPTHLQNCTSEFYN